MSWWQLASIYEEAAAYKRQEQTEPPTACPFDGEPLRSVPGGGDGLYCPFGNYEWPQQPRLI